MRGHFSQASLLVEAHLHHGRPSDGRRGTLQARRRIRIMVWKMHVTEEIGMTTKLTLSAEPEVIEAAKRLAAETHTSVSAMFTRFIRALSSQDERTRTKADDIPADSITARLTGIVSLPKGKTERDVLTDALMEKYGLKK